MKPTGVPVQDEMFPEGVDSGLMDMDEVWAFNSSLWHFIYFFLVIDASLFTQKYLNVIGLFQCN